MVFPVGNWNARDEKFNFQQTFTIYKRANIQGLNRALPAGARHHILWLMTQSACYLTQNGYLAIGSDGISYIG